jgi:hypothetical protein
MARWRRHTALLGVVCTLPLLSLTGAGRASAAPPPDDPPPVTLPQEIAPPEPGVQPDVLIPVPVGCPVPDPAAVVFTGTMIGKDDVTQVVRFRIECAPAPPSHGQ